MKFSNNNYVKYILKYNAMKNNKMLRILCLISFIWKQFLDETSLNNITQMMVLKI